ncbi:Vacuolar protein sorting-associated protein 36 [Vitis vinifera]|uniref:Vacuolar protein-sorting-associated protein 36 n=1 Tax=Vitis vinifera TaxID=29760 RepID=A0A438HXD5_VITVI|nr:Vacuolar protein sorting-associated protein 36 [Vitis vinifera]
MFTFFTHFQISESKQAFSEELFDFKAQAGPNRRSALSKPSERVGVGFRLLPLFSVFSLRRSMAGKWIPAAELTASGRPVLCPGEIESSLLSSVDLHSEENPNFPNFKSGILILTTHRLLWISDSAPGTATAVAVPLAAISRIFPLKKSIKSMFASPRIRFQVSAAPDGKVDAGGSNLAVITLVLRGKGDHEAFVSKFWEAWRARAWESETPKSGSSSGTGGSGSREGESGWSSNGLRLAGVSGILRKEQEMWESTDKSLQEAFQDLNALMSKAKEMVMLAEKMRQKLLSGPTTQPGANDEEMGSKQEMQDWMLSVGIASPVTKESAGALYHQQLSRQVLLSLFFLFCNRTEVLNIAFIRKACKER